MVSRPSILPSVKLGSPKPEQIATVLEREILSGVLGFGERLQSENELVRRFSVSRNTVRKGLEALLHRGLITTRVGIGSFVTFNGQTIDGAMGWSRALASVGADMQIRTLRLEVIDDGELAATLDLPNTKFIALDRVRSFAGDKNSVSVERSRLPFSRELEDLPSRGLRNGSLHQTLREAGLVAVHGEEWADLEILGTDDAEILGCEPGAAFLRTRRLTRAGDGRPIELVTSLLDPAHFALHLEF